MRWLVLGAVALLAAGVLLVALSVVEGGARVALFVIVPVISGSSAMFLVGVGLLFVGFLAVPLSLAASWDEGPSNPPPERTSGPPPAGGVGGLILVGPVPILFGSWKGVSSRTRWALAVAGAVILTALVVWSVWFLQ